MRKYILTVTLSLMSIIAFSQITITDSDIIGIGDVIHQAYDDSPNSSITIGSAGANQNWDFSTLQASDSYFFDVIDPVGTSWASIHPTANLCIDDGSGELMYVNKSDTGVYLVGVNDLPYPRLFVPLPLSYGASTSIGPDLIMDSVFVNMFIPDSVAMFATAFQAHTIDSIAIKVTSVSDFNVDAYGDITVPMGTFPCLRLKLEDITTTDVFIYCTDTLTGSGSGWYAMPQFIFPSEVESIMSYQWWTNDTSVKFILVETTMDSIGNIEEVTFLNQSGASYVNELESDHFTIYPIPSTYSVTIISEKNDNVDAVLTDLNGKVITTFNFLNSTELDFSKHSKGTYLLNLQTKEGSFVKKLIIE